MNECMTLPFFQVETSMFHELFEGRFFHHRGGSVSVANMAEVLCPPSYDTDDFQLRLRSVLDEQNSVNGLRVLTFDHGGERCQVRILRVGMNLLATCTTMPLENDTSLRTDQIFDVLSKREREVLELLVSGMANKQVAAALYLSPRTIEKHRANIHKKTGTRSLAVLTQMWVETSHSRNASRALPQAT